LGMDVGSLMNLLSNYVIDDENSLYQFEMSPVLKLVRSNSNGDEIFLFNVYDKELINWRLYFDTPDHAGANPRALGVIIRGGRIHAVKVWHFEKLKDGSKPRNIYRGKLHENIGLGDLVSGLLPYIKLNYDDAEELFRADREGLEVTGYGDIDEYPNQIVMAIAVIFGASDSGVVA
jgi:hypothetical protein